MKIIVLSSRFRIYIHKYNIYKLTSIFFLFFIYNTGGLKILTNPKKLASSWRASLKNLYFLADMPAKALNPPPSAPLAKKKTKK